VVEQVLALSEQGQHEQAIRQLEQLNSADQSTYDATLVKAMVQQNAGNTAVAISLLESLTESSPEQPEAFNNLAVIYAQAGDYTRAIETLQAAMNTHPSYATVQRNLKDIYATLASQAYNKALDIQEEQSPPALARLTTAPGTQPETAVKPVVSTPVVAQKKVEKASAPAITAMQRQPEQVAAVTVTSITEEPNAADTSGELQQVGSLLEQWSSAWRNQNPAGYVEAYTSNYHPSPEMSHSEWVQQRHNRLTQPKYIKVALSDISISLLRHNLSEAYFEQRYESDSFKDAVKKRLLLVKENGQWRISHERTLAYID
jgi:tetratricopeptide (TPR) repeat protein